MSQQSYLRLRHLIIAGYAVPILALVLSAIATVVNVNRVNELTTTLRISDETDTSLSELEVSTERSAKALRGYLLDQSPASLQLYQETRDVTKQTLDKLKLDVADNPPEQMQMLSQIEPLIADLNVDSQTQANLAQQGKLQEMMAAWKGSNVHQNAGEIKALIERLKLSQDKVIDSDRQQQINALAQLKNSIFLATGSSILLSALICFWVIKRTSRQMTEAAAMIAASATEIAATIEQQERIANQQAASVNQTTTTMDELGASSRQSAEQVEAAALSAEQALSLSGSGTKAVHRTLDGMTNLRQKVEVISDQILRLSEQTIQIGTISSVVGDLANQTNMLALNAAVEAVRAGEHGKGFAVVAAEIRKLADESKKSSQKISALVTDIQTSISSTVIATDEGTKTVEEGGRIAEGTSESFAGVVNAVNTVTLNSQQISLNIRQQAIAIDQVVQAMNALNTAAKESATGVGQIKDGIHQLNQAALDLKAVV